MTNEHEYNDIQHAGFWRTATIYRGLPCFNMGELEFWGADISASKMNFAVIDFPERWKHGDIVTIEGKELFRIIHVDGTIAILKYI